MTLPTSSSATPAPAAPVKLTKAQLAVVDLLNNGWVICATNGIGNKTQWLQQGEFGNGADRPLARSIFETLRRQGLIRIFGEKYSAKMYCLTSATAEPVPPAAESPTPAAPVKLTKAQQDVFNLLQGDWEIGYIGTFISETRAWVQQYGGGGHKRIAKSIFDALLKQGLIALHAEKYPVKKYRLAAKVQTAAPAA